MSCILSIRCRTVDVQRYILLTNQPQTYTFRKSIRRSAANVWSRPVITLKYTNIKFPLAMILCERQRREFQKEWSLEDLFLVYLPTMWQLIWHQSSEMIFKGCGRKNPGVIWILLSRSLLGETNKITKSQSDILTGLWFEICNRGLNKMRQACYWSYHKVL